MQRGKLIPDSYSISSSNDKTKLFQILSCPSVLSGYNRLLLSFLSNPIHILWESGILIISELKNKHKVSTPPLEMHSNIKQEFCLYLV